MKKFDEFYKLSHMRHAQAFDTRGNHLAKGLKPEVSEEKDFHEFSSI